MRTIFSVFYVGGLIFMLIFIALTVSADETVTTTSTISKQQSSTKHSKELTATGAGAMPTEQEMPNRAKAYLQAKGYAQAQAVANLMQAARGTSISYSATGKDYAMDERVSQEISGMVENVRVVSERRIQIGKDTVVEVTVSAPIPKRWQDTPAAKHIAATDMPWKVASVSQTIQSPSSFRRAKDEPYTSVIIDAIGLDVVRSMSPKILRADSSEVWGTVKVDYDFIADHGIVAYARTMGEAYANARAGDNPLVIRALQRGPSPYKCDVILSNDDADYLLSENHRTQFLKDFRVIFLVDAND